MYEAWNLKVKFFHHCISFYLRILFYISYDFFILLCVSSDSLLRFAYQLYKFQVMCMCVCVNVYVCIYIISVRVGLCTSHRKIIVANNILILFSSTSYIFKDIIMFLVLLVSPFNIILRAEYRRVSKRILRKRKL